MEAAGRTIDEMDRNGIKYLFSILIVFPENKSALCKEAQLTEKKNLEGGGS